jgi:membrane-associated phospholipid phosphatase
MNKLDSKNNRRGQTALFLAVVFVIWVTYLLLAAPHDLAASIHLNDDSSGWARWMQDYGTLPSLILYVAAAIYLLIPPLRRLSEVAKKAALALLLMFVLDPMLITTGLKMVWGRLRFIQLHGDWSLFTEFYQINQSFPGVSFPSGHVATATVFFPIAWLLMREGRGRAAFVVAATTTVWGIAMALSRIILGAHYLTDTIFSMGLSVMLAPPVAWAARKLSDRYFVISRKAT